MAPKAHHAHMERLLRPEGQHDPSADASAVPISENDYLGPVDEGWLWELVGFRVRGHPWTLLALMQFRRQSTSVHPHGRVSLVQHLTSPAHAHRSNGVRPPGDVLPIVPIPASEEVGSFLERTRNGDLPPVTWLDRASIQLAFDFRGENPSVRRGPAAEKPGQRRRMRTVEGHVIEARAAAFHAKLHRDFEFIALLDGVQRTPDSIHPLPTVIASRAFLVAERAGPPTGGEEASSPGDEPTLFAPDYASADLLLR